MSGDCSLHSFVPLVRSRLTKTLLFCADTRGDYGREIRNLSVVKISLVKLKLLMHEIKGLPGFTAWIGIEVIGNPAPGSNVFISAAAGGVGTFAGQFAKLKGCRVVGSTGSDEKVQILRDEFGYDEAFNYNKESDFDAALAKYFPNGIDLYLDNVGGKMLEAVLNHVNKGSRIVITGMMSQYNTIPAEREGVNSLLNMVGKEVKMEGFLCGSYLNRFGEFVTQMETYMKEEKIKSKHKIYQGIESFLDSFASVFSSSNMGKVIVQVAT
ncbi:NADP(+)-dependent 2-alkenal reductase-like protein [Tanacetum coccineum]